MFDHILRSERAFKTAETSLRRPSKITEIRIFKNSLKHHDNGLMTPKRVSIQSSIKSDRSIKNDSSPKIKKRRFKSKKKSIINLSSLGLPDPKQINEPEIFDTHAIHSTNSINHSERKKLFRENILIF